MDSKCGSLVMVHSSGEEVTYHCNVLGYRPEEIKVYVQERKLVVRALHTTSGERQRFTSYHSIENNVAEDTLNYNVTPNGLLIIKMRVATPSTDREQERYREREYEREKEKESEDRREMERERERERERQDRREREKEQEKEKEWQREMERGREREHKREYEWQYTKRH